MAYGILLIHIKELISTPSMLFMSSSVILYN